MGQLFLRTRHQFVQPRLSIRNDWHHSTIGIANRIREGPLNKAKSALLEGFVNEDECAELFPEHATPNCVTNLEAIRSTNGI